MEENIIFAPRSLFEIVIRKGGGIRPNEALATLRFIEEGAAFYHAHRGKITLRICLDYS